jgi:hypothetical protein
MTKKQESSTTLSCLCIIYDSAKCHRRSSIVDVKRHDADLAMEPQYDLEYPMVMIVIVPGMSEYYRVRVHVCMSACIYVCT